MSQTTGFISYYKRPHHIRVFQSCLRRNVDSFVGIELGVGEGVNSDYALMKSLFHGRRAQQNCSRYHAFCTDTALISPLTEVPYSTTLTMSDGEVLMPGHGTSL